MHKISLTFNGEVSPLTLRYNATTPLIYGVAIDVPCKFAYPPRLNGKVEKMFCPGAATLGLIASSLVGPKVLNIDINPPLMLLGINDPVASDGKKRFEFGFDLRNCPSWGEITDACQLVNLKTPTVPLD